MKDKPKGYVCGFCGQQHLIIRGRAFPQKARKKKILASDQ